MKPQDLIPPCSREEKHVCIHERVWYVPIFSSEKIQLNPFVFPGWDHPDFFGNNNPVHVEYCSGNGAWIAEKAVQHPTINWIAVERKFERVRKLWSKIHNLNLKNLIVLCGEAAHATEKFFPAHSIQNIYINFPDPWPKRRHERHRLIQVPFLQQLSSILTPDGKLTVVTDDKPHSEWLIETAEAHGKFTSSYPDPFYLNNYQEYGSSYFESLWRSQGKTIYYHEYYVKQ